MKHCWIKHGVMLALLFLVNGYGCTADAAADNIHHNLGVGLGIPFGMLGYSPIVYPHA